MGRRGQPCLPLCKSALPTKRAGKGLNKRKVCKNLYLCNIIFNIAQVIVTFIHYAN